MTDDLGNTLYKRGTYFPNVNTGAGNLRFPQAPGVAEGQARMDQLAATGTYKSRRDDFRNKYPQFANPTAQQNLQQFDLSQAYQQGYGAPSATTQQGPGGPYRVAGGVSSPIPNPPNIFQNLASNLGAGTRAIGQIASNIGQAGVNAYAGFRNTFFPNVQVGQTPSASQAVQNYQQYGSFAPSPGQPRRYFD